MFINREKETKKELERLQNYSNAETLSTANIAIQVRNTIKRKKKEDFQQDNEEVQVAHIISQEKFNAELQKNKVLQDDLKLSKDKLTAEVHLEKQKNMDLREELEVLVQNMRDEQDTLRQKTAEDIRLSGNDSADRAGRPENSAQCSALTQT